MASNDIHPGNLSNEDLARVVRNAMLEDFTRGKPWSTLQIALLTRFEKLLDDDK